MPFSPQIASYSFLIRTRPRRGSAYTENLIATDHSKFQVMFTHFPQLVQKCF